MADLQKVKGVLEDCRRLFGSPRFQNYEAYKEIKEALAELTAFMERLESDEFVKEIALTIANMAECNMCLDGNGKPVLFNDEGIAQAAINVIKGNDDSR